MKVKFNMTTEVNFVAKKDKAFYFEGDTVDITESDVRNGLWPGTKYLHFTTVEGNIKMRCRAENAEVIS